MLPSAWRVPMIVTVMLSFRSDVLPATFIDTWTALPNTTLTSQLVLEIVMEVEESPLMVPRATACVPGEGDAAPGLGHTAPAVRPPPATPLKLPGVREACLAVFVLALTLFCPTLNPP